MAPGADVIVKLAETLDVSCDHLLIDAAPRRPFAPPGHHLGDRLAQLDALIAKNRVRNALREAS